MEIQIFNRNHSDQVVNLFNNNSEWDTLSKKILHEKVFDDPFYEKELNFTAWDKNTLIGFLSGVTRKIKSENIGYIKLMVIHKQFRRKGIGNRLYKKLEHIFRERGIKKISIYDVPYNYFMPGIDPRYTPAIAFFETMGFHRFSDTANMIVHLTNMSFNTDKEENVLSHKGIIITRASLNDREEILNFIKTDFPGWRYEAEKAFDSSPISLHIARCKGKIMAFSAHNCNNKGTGWFGPMGTNSELRGMGVGSVLLKRCMQDMKESGLKESIIPWVGPIRFYSYYVNAVIQRVFWRYKKTLA